MDNIFENAYFGKPYKTRDGRKAILVNWNDNRTKVFLYVKERDMEFYGEEMYELDGTTSRGSTPHDIVSEWQEPINEVELDKIAFHDILEVLNSDHFDGRVSFKTFKEIYKAGYRKTIGG